MTTFESLHEDARRVLSRWTHPEPAQMALRDEYLAFLDAHPDAMSRGCRVGHLTSSALVMDEDRARVLLTLHPKAGRWLQLGGHNELGDEGIRAAALREVTEESGIPNAVISPEPIRLDRHRVACGGGQSEHLDVEYLALVPVDAVPVMSAESDDLRWFPLDDLPRPLDHAVRAMIATAVSEAARVDGAP